MARTLTYKDAIREALWQEMERDPLVVVFGEDVAGGAGTDQAPDAWGGVLGATKGLYGQYPGRVLDTPISESAFIGAAAGAAATGLRPVVELMFVDFIGVCLDQIYNQAAKFRYMFGGKVQTPLVIRALYGAGFRAAAQHSQALYPVLTHIPGLKVVVPSTPYDAKGLLIQSIRDPDPVVFLEHKALYGVKGEVPAEPYAIPLGQANVVRDGDDITMVAIGRMVHVGKAAAETLAKDGIEVEVIDPRTTSPIDMRTILDSVRRTRRLIVVDESSPRCGMAADIISMVTIEAFDSLQSAPQAVTPPHVPVPFSPALEDAYVPSEGLIVTVATQLMQGRSS